MKVFVNRLLAFAIDYTVIAVYGVLLFGLSTWISSSTGLHIKGSPVIGQLIGFLTVTIPVFLYFYLAEKGNHKATIGKRMRKLCVTNSEEHVQRPVLIRNLIKFIPWEIAHAGVHWMKYYEREGIENPMWVWFLLIIPQLIVIAYIISILQSKGHGSFYDHIAGTRVVSVTQSEQFLK